MDEFLLRVYLELKQCLNQSEFPDRGGVRPLRACGTRFLVHEVCALERIIDRFRAYLNHLVALIDDPKTKVVDR